MSRRNRYNRSDNTQGPSPWGGRVGGSGMITCRRALRRMSASPPSTRQRNAAAGGMSASVLLNRNGCGSAAEGGCSNKLTPCGGSEKGSDQ